MAENSQDVATRFIASDLVSPAIKRIGASVEVLNTGLTKLNSIGSLVGLTAGIGSVAAIGTALVSASNKSITMYENYEQQQVKLITIMKQRMGANAAMVSSVNSVIAAETKLGVVGGSTQRAGAQQLATFLHSAEALNSLIPAMNNLAVQQRGYKATAEDLTGIANLMGRVLEGNVGALTRVGISLSEQDKQLLKTLPEQEKAALLAQVITNNVGKMNAALAETPEGKKIQAMNRLNGAWTELGSRLAGIKDSIVAEMAGSQLTMLSAVGGGIAVGFAVISGAVMQTIHTVETLGSTAIILAGNFAPLIMALGVTYAVFQMAAFAQAVYATITYSATAATAAHTTAILVGNHVIKVRRSIVAAMIVVMIAYRSGITLATIAQASLNLITMAFPGVIIIGLVLAVIGVLAHFVESMGGVREVAASVWESVVNTVGWAVNKIIGLINMVISGLNKAAGLMNRVFKTDFTPIGNIGQVDVSRIAYGGGDAIRNGTVIEDLTNFFAPKAIDPGDASNFSGIGDVMGDIDGNVGKIAKTTQQVSDKIEMTNEEIEALRGAAQREVLRNYMNQPITITVVNHNTVSSDTDLDGMTGNIVKGLREAAATVRKGPAIKGAMG